MTDKSVWVIERGSYSDYTVLGVYSSKKNADLANSLLSGDNQGTVSKWPMDEGVDFAKLGLIKHCVLILRDGKVESVTRESYVYDFEGEKIFLWKREEVETYKGKNIPNCLSVTVWAKDPTHAIKIANEKRTHFIASGKWELTTKKKVKP